MNNGDTCRTTKLFVDNFGDCKEAWRHVEDLLRKPIYFVGKINSPTHPRGCFYSDDRGGKVYFNVQKVQSSRVLNPNDYQQICNTYGII